MLDHFADELCAAAPESGERIVERALLPIAEPAQSNSAIAA